MSIAFGTSAVGTKTVTGGTSFTITITVAAGNMIVVIVSSTSSGSAIVSSITDAGNVYRKIGSVTQSGATAEVWASNPQCVASGGTITVNVTTGFRCVGIAASYSGVEVIDLLGNAVGSTSPFTSGTKVLRENSSWMVTGGALAAANTFTASSGSLRNQGTTTALAGVLIDSNGATGSVTNSATMTAAVWGGVNVFLRFGTGAPYYNEETPKSTPRLASDLGFAYSRVEPLAFTQLQRIVPVEATQTIIYRNPTNLPQKYASPDVAFTQLLKSVVTTPTVAALTNYLNPGSLQQKFNQSDYIGSAFPLTNAPGKDSYRSEGTGERKGHYETFKPRIIPPAQPIGRDQNISSGSYAGPYHYVGFTKPVAPQPTAVTSFLPGWLSTDGWKSVVLKYAQPDFIEQLFPTRVLTPLGYLSYDANRIVPAPYAQPDFVSQLNPTRVLNSLGYLSYDANRVVTNTYAPSDFAKPTFVPTAIPSIGGWFGTDGQKSVVLKYATPDFVNQIYPTRVLNSLGYLSYDANRIVPSPYSQIEFAKPTFVPTAVPSIGGWTGTDGQKSVVLTYAQPDFVNQINPTRVLNSLGYLQYLGPVFRGTGYSQSAEDVNPGAPILPTITGWQSFDGARSLPQIFAPTDFVKPVFVPTAIASLIGGWLGTDGAKAVQLNYAPTDFVNQIFPTLYLLPRLSQLAEPGVNAQPQRFTIPSWDAPPKLGLATVALPTIDSWFPTAGQNSVVLKYSLTDFVNQIFPTLAQLARLSQLAEPGVNAQPQRFTIPAWDAPPKLGLATVATPTIAGWFPTEGMKAVVPPHVQSDFINQLIPTRVLTSLGYLPYDANKSVVLNYAPSDYIRPTVFQAQFISGWFGTDGAEAVKLVYAPSDFAKPTFVPVPTVFPAALFGNIGQNALPQKYAISDFINQVRPTLATLPLFTAELTKPAANAVVLNYAPIAWDAPPKLGLATVALPTIDSWTPTIGLPSVILRYAQPEFINQLRPTLALLPLITSEWTKPGNPAVILNYAIPAWDAPPKLGLSTPIVGPLAGWLPTEGLKAVLLKYALSDFVNQVRPTLANLPLFSAELTKPAANAVVLNYATPAWDAPPKLGLSTPAASYTSAWGQPTAPSAFLQYWNIYDAPQHGALGPVFYPTFSGWTPDNFQNAIPSPYSQTLPYLAPEKVIPPAPPTLDNWTPTIGSPAVLLKYAPGVLYLAPEKVIPYIPAKPTIDSWLPTIGPNAQPQKFAIPDLAYPPKFNIVIPPKALIERGVIFYKVYTETMDFYKEINKGVIVYKVFAVTTNLKQKLVQRVYVDKKTGMVLYIENVL